MLLVNDRSSLSRNAVSRPPSEASSEILDLVGLIRFLKRSAAFTAICSLVCVMLGLSYLVFIPPKYTARTSLLLDVKKPRAVQDQDAIPTNVAEIGYVESQVVVLQSALTIERVVTQLSLADDPEFNGAQGLRVVLARACSNYLKVCARPTPPSDETKFRSAVEHMRQVLVVQRIGASQVIEIAVTSPDKDKAATIANTVLNSYMEAQAATATRLTQEAIAWLEQRIEALRRQALEADRRLQDFKAGTGGPVDPTRRAFMLRELLSTSENHQALYQGFLNRYAQTAQQLSFPISDARVLTPATPPSVRAGPSAIVILAVSGLAGVMLGLAGSALRERLDQTVHSADALERITGVPCIALLPDVPSTHKSARARPHHAKPAPTTRECVIDGSAGHMRDVLRNPKSPFSRGMGLLLARLETRQRESGSVVIGVVGLNNDRVRATVCANLAFLAASLGRRAVLVDADPAAAELTRALAPRATTGGLEIAGSNGFIEQSLHTDAESGLAFLPSRAEGAKRTEVRCAAPPDWVSFVLEQVRQTFKLVLVDVPGPLESGEAHRAIEAVDELLLVVGAGQYTTDELNGELSNLRDYHQRIAGLIVVSAS